MAIFSRFSTKEIGIVAVLIAVPIGIVLYLMWPDTPPPPEVIKQFQDGIAKADQYWKNGDAENAKTELELVINETKNEKHRKYASGLAPWREEAEQKRRVIIDANPPKPVPTGTTVKVPPPSKLPSTVPALS